MSTDNAHILLVDDDLNIRLLIARYLERHGFTVQHAGSGGAALDYLGNHAVDLVLTDVNMPDLNGVELLDLIKQTCGRLPVVLLTGMPSIETAVQCLKLGANDYLSKPVELPRLLQSVRRVLEDGGSNPIQFGSQPGNRRIGSYRIVDRLGEGNVGQVVLAEHTASGDRVAIKILKPVVEPEERQRNILERFMREAEVAARITHPRIVQILDFGVDEETLRPYIVMEYVNGSSLRDLIISATPLAMDCKIRILRQVAEGLGAIHAHDFCHRDVKPANILLDRQYEAKVSDFGLIMIPDSELTKAGDLMGTVVYLSPEGFLSPKVDHRADLFCLGSVAYEFLTLERAFVAKGPAQYASAIQTSRPVEPCKINPEIPVSIQAILARLLKKRPADRFQSADELVAALDAAVAAGSGGAMSVVARVLGRLRNDWT